MAAMMESQLPQQDDLPLGHDTLMGLPELEAEFNAYSSTSAAISTPFINTTDHSHQTITVESSSRKYRSGLDPRSSVIGPKSVFGNITQYVLFPRCDSSLIWELVELKTRESYINLFLTELSDTLRLRMPTSIFGLKVPATQLHHPWLQI
jgi:hypothetical protein